MLTASTNRGEIGEIGELIAASAAQLSRAAVVVPGQRPVVFRFELSRLMQEQEQLERAYRHFIQESQQRALGALWLPILAAGSLVASLGAWAWKQHEETSRVETRAEMYKQFISQGLSPEEAARLAFGTGGGVSQILDKLLLLGALGLGAFLLLRKWR